jgi:flotillin
VRELHSRALRRQQGRSPAGRRRPDSNVPPAARRKRANNLAAPHAALVASQARIARATADQEATERELQVAAMKAQYERDTAIKRAGFLAETEEAKAKAAQAGPLAEAQASQQVIEQQTALAEREAALAAQRLEAAVRRPADAEAYRKRTLAEADRDRARLAADAEAYRSTTLAEALAQATRVQASAAGDAARAKAGGEAAANTALAGSLRDGNQELIAASSIIDNLPTLVEAASRGIADSNLTILNGAQGVSEMIAGLVAQGLSVLELLRSSTASPNSTPVIPAGVQNGSPVSSPAAAVQHGTSQQTDGQASPPADGLAG